MLHIMLFAMLFSIQCLHVDVRLVEPGIWQTIRHLRRVSFECHGALLWNELTAECVGRKRVLYGCILIFLVRYY
jgi:hypothetical protein